MPLGAHLCVLTCVQWLITTDSVSEWHRRVDIPKPRYHSRQRWIDGPNQELVIYTNSVLRALHVATVSPFITTGKELRNKMIQLIGRCIQVRRS